MKPLIKLFGYGVYRVDSAEQLNDDFLRNERLAWTMSDSKTRSEIKIAATLQYLSTLKGRRASKKKVMELLKG